MRSMLDCARKHLLYEHPFWVKLVNNRLLQNIVSRRYEKLEARCVPLWATTRCVVPVHSDVGNRIEPFAQCRFRSPRFFCSAGRTQSSLRCTSVPIELARHGGLHPVIENLTWYAAHMHELFHVTAQHGLQIVMFDETRAYSTGRVPSKIENC
jgi:hypothetical protein